jgi:hypothetical protein
MRLLTKPDNALLFTGPPLFCPTVCKTVTVTVAKAQEGPPVASAGRRVERGLAKRIEQADAWRIVDAVPCTAGWRRPTTAEPGA